MSFIDLERAHENYYTYKLLREDLEYAQEDLRKIEIENKEIKYYMNILEALEYANKKNYSRYDETINKFLEEHKEIEEIKNLKYYIGTYLSDINTLKSETICIPQSQIILLTKNDKKFLADLKHLEVKDVTDFNPKFVSFIIDVLKKQGYFIGNANESDLPLLMCIKEDIEKDKENSEEDYYYENDTLAYQIALEFENAKLEDEKTNFRNNTKLKQFSPFIFNCEEIQKKWEELDELESKISKEEYLLRYYKLLMIFGNDVAKVYKEASEEEKKYVLDAYEFYSSIDNKNEEINHHFRTTSPEINIEILKRKMLNKK